MPVEEVIPESGSKVVKQTWLTFSTRAESVVAVIRNKLHCWFHHVTFVVRWYCGKSRFVKVYSLPFCYLTLLSPICTLSVCIYKSVHEHRKNWARCRHTDTWNVWKKIRIFYWFNYNCTTVHNTTLLTQNFFWISWSKETV